MALMLEKRRGALIEIDSSAAAKLGTLSTPDLQHFEQVDLLYRSLCALMYNHVPMSGHPGGSISAGPRLKGAHRTAVATRCVPKDSVGPWRS
jgi:hypothetical protein